MYLADVAIGDDSQSFRLLVDTGSPMVLIPGSALSKRTNRFDASKAKPGNRTVSIKFGLGSVAGHVFQDRVCVQTPGGAAPLTEVGFLQQHSQTQAERASSDSRKLVEGDMDEGGACAQMSFVVVDQESDDLAEEPFDGILGLGPESSSDAGMTGAGFSLLSQLAASGATRSTAFALRLSNSGSSELLLGGVDESSFAGGRAIWVPISPAADGYWQFSVQDITLDGQSQQFGGLQVSVDSGTSLLAADDELRDWFREHLLPKDCNAVDHLPKLGLRIHGGSILSILPADYIDQTEGKCSLALMPSPLQSVSGQRLVLGDSFLRRYTTIFDRDNARMGFGVATDDGMAKELLPGMFPDPTTTMAPQTTEGPPPPEHLDYSRAEYVPVTTRPPPTAEELEAAHQQADLSNAFSGLGDDLAGSFENAIAKEKHSEGLNGKEGANSAVEAKLSAGVTSSSQDAQTHEDQAPANPYIGYLSFMQI